MAVFISHLLNPLYSKGSPLFIPLIIQFLPGPLGNSWTFDHVPYICRWLSPTLISVFMNTGCCPRGKGIRRTLWWEGEDMAINLIKMKTSNLSENLTPRASKYRKFHFYAYSEDIINFMRWNVISSQPHNHNNITYTMPQQTVSTGLSFFSGKEDEKYKKGKWKNINITIGKD